LALRISNRTTIRRLTRSTNAFSKKIENHAYAVALHVMYYNFVRIHPTLRITPAMAAGVTNRPGEIEDIIRIVALATVLPPAGQFQMLQTDDYCRNLRERVAERRRLWWYTSPPLCQDHSQAYDSNAAPRIGIDIQAARLGTALPSTSDRENDHADQINRFGRRHRSGRRSWRSACRRPDHDTI
jgi:hypothetical protein